MDQNVIGNSGLKGLVNSTTKTANSHHRSPPRDHMALQSEVCSPAHPLNKQIKCLLLCKSYYRDRILVQVTIYHRLLNERDGHLDHRSLRYIVTCTRIRAQKIHVNLSPHNPFPPRDHML